MGKVKKLYAVTMDAASRFDEGFLMATKIEDQDQEESDSKLLQNLLNIMPELESLKVHNTSFHNQKKIRSFSLSHPCLSRIAFKACSLRNLTTDKIPNLKRVDLYSCDTLRLKLGCSSMKKLLLFECHAIYHGLIENVLQCCPDLQTISIRKCQLICGEIKVLRHPNLESITVYSTDMPSFTMRDCPNLRQVLLQKIRPSIENK